MFRGLDISGRNRRRVPILTADRPAFEVTLYTRRDADGAERRSDVRERLQRLSDAGVVESVNTHPLSESPRRSWFEHARPDALVLAIRRQGTLVGWYPRRTTDGISSVEDGLSALRTGDGVENVRQSRSDRNQERERRPVSADNRPDHPTQTI